MRHLLLALCLLATLAAEEDPLAGLRFVNGQEYRLSNWPGQPVLIMYFCGHCPNAKKWMSTQAVEIGKRIDSDRQAAQLICVTPELSGEALKNYAKSNCAEIADTALFAHDPANRQNISLKNIAQAELWVDGKKRDVGFDQVTTAVAEPFKTSTAFRFPLSGDLTEKGKAAWWAIERGRPGAIASCFASSKKNADAKAVMAMIEPKLIERQTSLLAGPVTLETYEALENLSAESAGIPSLKPAAEQLREMKKDKTIAEELKARDIYRSAFKQAASVKPSEAKAGAATLAELAKRMPQTVYGAKAAASVK
jgi:hypothetical protein